MSAKRKEVRCFKHYCRACHTMEFVKHGAGYAVKYPTCCRKPMAYLGIVDAVPGRDETLKQAASRSASRQGSTEGGG